MRIKKITYISEVNDIYNDNIDVSVETDDGISYVFVVTTPKNYYWYMDKEEIDYIPASPPDIIVRSLTLENIRKALESYVENNGYWLKLYYLAGKQEGIFSISTMNQMIKKIKYDSDKN